MLRNRRLYRHGTITFSVDYDLEIGQSLVTKLDQHFRYVSQCHGIAQISFKFMFGKPVPNLSKRIFYTNKQKFICEECIMVHEGKDLLILQTDENSHYPTIIRHKKNEFQFFTFSPVKVYFFYIFRFIQELLYTFHECEKWIAYHASGIVLDNKGILISGSSCSGKTTLLSYLCIFANAGFIGNESILVKDMDALYDPTHISFRKDTIKAIEKKISFRHNLHYMNKNYTTKYNEAFSVLSPVNLSKALNISLHAKCKIYSIIIPDFQISYNGVLTNEKIEPAEACALLSENSISRMKEWNHKKLTNIGLTPKEIAENTFFQSNLLASKVPITRIVFGPSTDPCELVDMIAKASSS